MVSPSLAWPRGYRRHGGWGQRPPVLGRAEGDAGAQGWGLGRKTGDPAQQEGPDTIILSGRPADACVRTQDTRESVQVGAAGGLGFSPLPHNAG